MAPRDAGEPSPLTFAKYKEVCDFLASRLGKDRVASDLGADDFAERRPRWRRAGARCG